MIGDKLLMGGVQLQPEGNFVAVGGLQSTSQIRLFDRVGDALISNATLTIPNISPLVNAAPLILSFSNDGKWLVSGHRGDSLGTTANANRRNKFIFKRSLDGLTYEYFSILESLEAEPHNRLRVNSVEWHPNNNFLMIGYSNSSTSKLGTYLNIFKIEGDNFIDVSNGFRLPESVGCVKFSNDGKAIITELRAFEFDDITGAISTKDYSYHGGVRGWGSNAFRTFDLIDSSHIATIETAAEFPIKYYRDKQAQHEFAELTTNDVFAPEFISVSKNATYIASCSTGATKLHKRVGNGYAVLNANGVPTSGSLMVKVGAEEQYFYRGTDVSPFFEFYKIGENDQLTQMTAPPVFTDDVDAIGLYPTEIGKPVVPVKRRQANFCMVTNNGNSTEPYNAIGEIVDTKIYNRSSATNMRDDLVTFTAHNIVCDDSALYFYGVANSNSEIVDFYKRSTVYTEDYRLVKLTSPAQNLSAGTRYGINVSPDGLYVAFGFAVSPWLEVYKREGDVLTKLAAVSGVTTDSRFCEFSPDGNYVFAGGSTTLNMIKRVGDTFSLTQGLSGLAAQVGYAVHPSLPYVVSASGFIFRYDTSANTIVSLGSKLNVAKTSGSNTVGNSTRPVCWSPDGNFVAFSGQAGVNVYEFNSTLETLTRVQEFIYPATTGAEAYSCFTADNKRLINFHGVSGGPSIRVFSWDSTLKELSNFTEAVGLSDSNVSAIRGAVVYPKGDRGVIPIEINQYAVITSEQTPYFKLYNLQDSTLEFISDPVVPPTGAIRDSKFNSDGSRFIAVGEGEKIYSYTRLGSVLTKEAIQIDPAIVSTITDFDSNSDGSKLYIGFSTAPYLRTYTRTVDTYVENMGEIQAGDLPSGSVTEVTIANTGNFLAVSHSGFPYISLYEITGGVISSKVSLASVPAGNATSVTFTKDDLYMVVGFEGSQRLNIYKASGNTYVRLADANVPPSANPTCLGFSNDGLDFFVGLSINPYVERYSRVGDQFTKQSQLSQLPTGKVNQIKFDDSGRILAMATETSPYVATYRKSNTGYTKLPDPVELPAAVATSISFFRELE